MVGTLPKLINSMQNAVRLVIVTRSRSCHTVTAGREDAISIYFAILTPALAPLRRQLVGMNTVQAGANTSRCTQRNSLPACPDGALQPSSSASTLCLALAQAQ